MRHKAKVAELVDALALGASGVTRESSSLSFRTKYGNWFSHTKLKANPGSGKCSFFRESGVTAIAGRA